MSVDIALTKSSSKGCGIWFQRITEFFDLDPAEALKYPQHYKAEFNFDVSSNVPKPPAIFSPTSSKKRRFDTTDFSDLAEDDVSLFKRIRLISKQSHPRKAQDGPFSCTRIDPVITATPISAENTADERFWQDLKSATSVSNRES